MYYVDCACGFHDKWKKFETEKEANVYFMQLNCFDKILYTETTDPRKPFFVITEQNNGRLAIS